MARPKKIKIKRKFTAKRIASQVAKLGKTIRKEAGDSEVFLLGILKGTNCFLADLLRAIPGEVTFSFIDVIRDVSDTETASALEIDFLSHTSISARHVYVLKDVVSTGIIENYLLAQLRLHNPRSLHLVALLDRPSLRTVDIKTDFRVFEVGAGSFVGYGLELEGRHANLPYIASVE